MQDVSRGTILSAGGQWCVPRGTSGTNGRRYVPRGTLDAAPTAVPTRINLRSDCGTAIGSRHSQPGIFLISSKSRAPTHKTTFFTANFSKELHARKSLNSPKAREHI